MMKQILGLAGVVIALTLALPAAGQGRKIIRYGCAGGQRVTVTYGAGWAEVAVGGRSSRLNALPSGAGSRYSDGRWVWRVTGSIGVLTRDGRTIAHSCRAL